MEEKRLGLVLATVCQINMLDEKQYKHECYQACLKHVAGQILRLNLRDTGATGDALK